MRVLYLPIKKKWFDMILAGKKKEEYRKRSPYWQTRIGNSLNGYKKPFTHVCFMNGYHITSPRAIFKIKWIREGFGLSEWGADKRKRYFIVRLAERWDTVDL